MIGALSLVKELMMFDYKYSKKYKAKNRKAHLCVACGKPNNRDTNLCVECSKKNYTGCSKRVQQKLKLQICTICGQPNPTNKYRCPSCTQEQGQKYKEQNKISKQKLLAERRTAVLHHYGNICACCGEDNPLFLCIDHMNNDGAKHRKEFKLHSGGRLEKWLIDNNFPNEFQILCYNCNVGKWRNKGICPHKEKGGEDDGREQLSPSS